MQTQAIVPHSTKKLYRDGMTAEEADEINLAEALALDWQTEARRTGGGFAARMAREYTQRAFNVAAKFGVATCVKPFQMGEAGR